MEDKTSPNMLRKCRAFLDRFSRMEQGKSISPDPFGLLLPWESVYVRQTNETILARMSPDDIFNVIALRPAESNKNLFCKYVEGDKFIPWFFIPALVQALRRSENIIVYTGCEAVAEQAKQICLGNNRSYVEVHDLMQDGIGTKILTGNCMAVVSPVENADPLHTIFCDAMQSGALDKGNLHIMIDDLCQLPASEAVAYHTVTTQARWTICCTDVNAFFQQYGKENAESIMHRCVTHILYGLNDEREAKYFTERIHRTACLPQDQLYICVGRGRYPTAAWRFDPGAFAFPLEEVLDQAEDVFYPVETEEENS